MKLVVTRWAGHIGRHAPAASLAADPGFCIFEVPRDRVVNRKRAA